MADLTLLVAVVAASTGALAVLREVAEAAQIHIRHITSVATVLAALAVAAVAVAIIFLGVSLVVREMVGAVLSGYVIQIHLPRRQRLDHRHSHVLAAIESISLPALAL